jgi:uncharacterized protein (TIGR02147 family)
MSDKVSKISIFNYLDYRDYLKVWYQEAKRTRRAFSYRYFSKKAGYNSPNFLKLVMDGDRNISEDGIPKFMLGLDLNKQEQEYFSILVLMNQAPTHQKKDLYYKKLLQSRKLRQLKPLKKDHYEYCSYWYHSVIRELVVAQNFDGTPEWIAKRIKPALSGEQVSKSIALLERLGLVKKDAQGHYQQSSPVLSTGDEPTAIDLMNLHRSILDLAKERLPNTEAKCRDVSALTLGIEREKIPLLKQKIQEFRKDILKMVSENTTPEEVVMVTMQMFPVANTQDPTEDSETPVT